ncbi:MAG: hypothetical protein RLZZ29_785 [Cyanobacteriota bacterium]|jgi:hypothetical protein
MIKQQGFLATFRIDEELWGKFKNIAKNKQTNASALIIQYIHGVVGGIDTPQNIDNSCQLSVHDIDNRIDEKISQSIQDINTPSIQNIEDLIDSRIKQSIADGDIRYAIAHSYAAAMGQFNGLLEEFQLIKKQMEELQSVPPSTAPIPPSADNSPALEIPPNDMQNIRSTLNRKNIRVRADDIRQAFNTAGWDGNNFQEIRKDILEILGGARK